MVMRGKMVALPCQTAGQEHGGCAEGGTAQADSTIEKEASSGFMGPDCRISHARHP